MTQRLCITSLTQLDEHFANVLAGEQVDERLRRGLESLADCLPMLQLALRHEAGQVLDSFSEARSPASHCHGRIGGRVKGVETQYYRAGWICGCSCFLHTHTHKQTYHTSLDTRQQLTDEPFRLELSRDEEPVVAGSRVGFGIIVS